MGNFCFLCLFCYILLPIMVPATYCMLNKHSLNSLMVQCHNLCSNNHKLPYCSLHIPEISSLLFMFYLCLVGPYPQIAFKDSVNKYSFLLCVLC